MSMKFKTGEITKLTNVKRNRLKEWILKGWIVPSIKRASGHGSPNVFSREDVYKIALFKKMTESGLSRALVGSFISSAQNTHVIEYLSVAAQEMLMVSTLDRIRSGGLVLKGIEGDEEKGLVKRGLLEAVKQLQDEVNIFLVFFLRKDGVTECQSILQGSEKVAGIVKFGERLNFPYLTDLSSVLRVAEEIYLLNFGEIVNDVEYRLRYFFPEKIHTEWLKIKDWSFEDHFRHMLQKISGPDAGDNVIKVTHDETKNKVIIYRKQEDTLQKIECKLDLLKQQLGKLGDSDDDRKKMKLIDHELKALNRKIKIEMDWIKRSSQNKEE